MSDGSWGYGGGIAVDEFQTGNGLDVYDVVGTIGGGIGVFVGSGQMGSEMEG